MSKASKKCGVGAASKPAAVKEKITLGDIRGEFTCRVSKEGQSITFSSFMLFREYQKFKQWQAVTADRLRHNVQFVGVLRGSRFARPQLQHLQNQKDSLLHFVQTGPFQRRVRVMLPGR